MKSARTSRPARARFIRGSCGPEGEASQQGGHRDATMQHWRAGEMRGSITVHGGTDGKIAAGGGRGRGDAEPAERGPTASGSIGRARDQRSHSTGTPTPTRLLPVQEEETGAIADSAPAAKAAAEHEVSSNRRR